MDAAIVKTHKTLLMPGLPEGWRYIGERTLDEYTKVSYIKCDRFTIGVYEDEFGVRHEYYHPADPEDKSLPHVNCVPGTHCTPELLAEHILDMFAYHLPNHRSNARMLSDGFHVSENTRMNWVRSGERLLKPLMECLRKQLFRVKTVLNIDETRCRVRIKFKGDGKKLGTYMKKYLWVIVNKKTQVTYFLYDNDENDSRGMRPIKSFLMDYSGAIQSDGYTVYRQLCKNNPNLIHLLCWAHVRAKFKYAEKNGNHPLAVWFINRIGLLYLIESECLLKGLSASETKERRGRRDVQGILDSLRAKATGLLSAGGIVEGDLMSKALNYMLNCWDDLLTYRDNGDYSIDNMIAERSIRPFTVGRKNRLHNSSERGMATTAFFHTLIETGKSRGLQMKKWMTGLIREMMHGNRDYEGLLNGAYCM